MGITKNVTGGRKYWQVRLAKKFTGGPIIRKKFSRVIDATDWIFGLEDFRDEGATPEQWLISRSEPGAPRLGFPQRRLTRQLPHFVFSKKTKLTLTEAVAYAVLHAMPPSG